MNEDGGRVQSESARGTGEDRTVCGSWSRLRNTLERMSKLIPELEAEVTVSE